MTTTRADQCRHGHTFTKANTYVGQDGWPRCRTCRTESNRRKHRTYTVRGQEHHRSLVARDAAERKALEAANASFVGALNRYGEQHDPALVKAIRANKIRAEARA